MYNRQCFYRVCFRLHYSAMSVHFLDRTDPTFVQDLKDSVVHVNEVVRCINKNIKNNDIVKNLQLEVMETTVRPDVRKRKRYADDGDVKVTWTSNGIPKHAMLEFKQRKSYDFKTLADFQYKDMFVDSLRKFNKINARGNTLGYVLTDQHMRCIFSTDMKTFEEHKIVKNTTFRDRRVQWCSLPKHLFHEGMENVCRMILERATDFDQSKSVEETCKEKQCELLRLAKKKIKRLKRKLAAQESLVQRLESSGIHCKPQPPNNVLSFPPLVSLPAPRLFKRRLGLQPKTQAETQ